MHPKHFRLVIIRQLVNVICYFVHIGMDWHSVDAAGAEGVGLSEHDVVVLENV